MNWCKPSATSILPMAPGWISSAFIMGPQWPASFYRSPITTYRSCRNSGRIMSQESGGLRPPFATRFVALILLVVCTTSVHAEVGDAPLFALESAHGPDGIGPLE